MTDKYASNYVYYFVYAKNVSPKWMEILNAIKINKS